MNQGFEHSPGAYAEALTHSCTRGEQFLSDATRTLLQDAQRQTLSDQWVHCQKDLIDARVLPELSLIADKRSLENALVSSQMAKLETKYGIQIAREGEPIREKLRRAEDGSFEGTGEWARARKPTLKELDALQGALERSQPSTKTSDGKPLVVSFAEEGFLPGSGGGKANFEPPNPEHPEAAALNIWPGARGVPALESDVVGERSHENTSLERILTHELSHLSNHNVEGMGMGVDAQYKRESGWVPTQEPPDQRTLWALRGKDGNLFVSHVQQGESRQMVWLKIQGDAGYGEKGEYLGQYLDANGEVVPADDRGIPSDPLRVVTLTNDQMREEAEVKPASDYFGIPEEAFAEAIAEFRMGESSRRRLLAESPEMYAVARKHDEAEISMFAGANEDGSSRKVRLPDGRLVDNNATNRRQIDLFEASVALGQ